jgi:glutamyl-tRNA synthetase
MSKVRTRFAPSPTGYIHVGGIRTALFAWLIARHSAGDFILRLEDTDQAREVAGADVHIMESLKSLGLEYNEGPDVGGAYGPYRQSERLAIYRQWAQKLIDSGRAYADPYTSAEVQGFRELAQKNKQPFLYRNHRPENPPAWDGTTALRFKSDPKSYTRTDAVMGELTTGPEVIDDFILIKSDGFPTYNFAHIVDDAEMGITHIIRGQEFLASIPNYLNLYEALGLTPPIIATMPHILGPDGNKKLSKRDGAKDVLDYIRDGYSQEALINFIASLGWNDGTEQEIFTVDELIKKFSLERVQRSGARFDEQRLLWMNGAWIRSFSLDDLYNRVEGFWPESAQNYDEDHKKAVLGLVQERLKYYAELPVLSEFFFTEPEANLELITTNKQLKKINIHELKNLLEIASKALADNDFSANSLQQALNALLEETGQKPGVLFSLIRIATTWAPASPSLAESLAVLGKKTTLDRLEKSISTLEKHATM